MANDKIHSTAESYQSASEIYEAGRPGYTEESVFALCEHLRLNPNSSLIELGAGTGKFTRLLLKKYSNLHCIEPVAAMLEKLKSLMPTISSSLGTGQSIPARDFCADAVLVANAFHWFSTEQALVEIARVLRAGGGLGLIWNIDGVFTSSWGREIDSWLDEIEGDTPQYKTGQWKNVFNKGHLFASLSEQRFSSTRITTKGEIIDRVMSISFVAALNDEARNAFRRRLVNHLSSHSETKGVDKLEVSFDTMIYWCFKLKFIR